LSRYCWQLAPVIPSPHLAQFKDFSPLLAQLLYNRGITEPVQFEPFLAADERLAGDPFLLSGMAEAVPRVIRALLKGELIAVYGDFDADGVTATAILTQGLSLLGNKAIPYIPHRVAEGHGLRHAALSELRQRGVSLVITVDCGVTAFAEVEGAQNEGLDIIITDHHALVSSLPPALAVINPKRDNSAYPFSGLAGVGVAFKLLQALFRASGKERRLDEFLDLVALGTVTDLVPLLGENRYLVKKGLETLNATSRPGLRELVLCAGLGLGNLDTENISYMLGPRLNAPGRLEHAFLSYELLVTTSSERGRQLAALLEEKNAERQRLTSHVLSKAKEELSPVDPDVPLLMVGGQDFPPGVIGVVAGKLVDEFYRPAVVLELGAEVSRGSCRSIPEFDITAALTQCCELLSHFGGHARAAGFTLPSNNVAALKRKLLEIARRELAGIHFRSTLAIDAEIPLSELSAETFKLVKMLAPFGQDNPAPTFLSHRVRVADWRCLGSKGEHLKLKLRDGDVVWDAIGFDLGHLSPDITPYLDIVYNLGEERWGGAELLRLNILDLLPVS
jgi:single-stranded-DNA-specific exonuclease